MKVFLVLITVCLSITSLQLLDAISEVDGQFKSIFLVPFLSVLVINAFSFGLLDWTHNSYDVSKTYPLVSIFFPLIYVVSLIKGEAEFVIVKVIGVSLVNIISIFGFETKSSNDETLLSFRPSISIHNHGADLL